MADQFTYTEIAEIVAQAHAKGLRKLTCPRDGKLLRFEIGTYLEVQRGKAGRGVKHGDFEDVQSIGVDCPTCGCNVASVSLTK